MALEKPILFHRKADLEAILQKPCQSVLFQFSIPVYYARNTESEDAMQLTSGNLQLLRPTDLGPRFRVRPDFL